MAEGPSSGAAKAKRSLFKRPAWAQTAATTTTTRTTTNDADEPGAGPTDLFSRNQDYAEFVEDRERQRRAREAKKKEKDERTRGEAFAAGHQRLDDDDDDDEAGTAKRRRISDDGVTEGTSTGGPAGRLTGRQRQDSRHSSVGSDHAAPAPEPRPQATVIELDDDDDDDVQPPTDAAAAAAATAEEDPDADLDEQYASDPEMLALARKAREKRRREERQRSEGAGAGDPTVKLLITSPMPGTRPLIVSRKLSQRMQEVREAWLGKQTFGADLARSVFFTFKLRKLYDVTTCRSLGVRVDHLGRVVRDTPFADLDEHAEKIHIEAVDNEWWQKLKDRKAAPKRNRFLDGADAGPARAEGTPADDEAAAQEPLIKITLKAKGHSDIKIKVRPSTTFAKIVNAARTRFSLSADRQVHLEFDGDRLEPPEGLVRDTDIDDMDCVEVHIK